MELNRLVFGGLALGCVAAAAAGGFLAARQNPGARTVAPSELAAPVANGAVAESEGVILPEATSTPEAPAPAFDVEATAPGRDTSSRPSRAVPEPRRPAVAPVTRSARNAPAPPPVETPPAAVPAGSGSMWETRPVVEPERPVIEYAPPAPEIVELVIPADSVLGLQIERTISSEAASVEDRVDARVTRDVRVGDRVAIPAGAIVQGSVVEVDRGGKIREKAKLAVRFHTVVLADGSRLNIRTDAVVREGASPAGESAAKIGGAAAGGAILGAILGGSRGAVIGGTVGAAGGTAATVAGGRNPAVLPAGSTVSVRIEQPVTVSVEQN